MPCRGGYPYQGCLCNVWTSWDLLSPKSVILHTSALTLRPVHTWEPAPRHTPATRSGGKAPSSAVTISSEKNMLRNKSSAPEFSSLISNWFDMRERASRANLLHEMPHRHRQKQQGLESRRVALWHHLQEMGKPSYWCYSGWDAPANCNQSHRPGSSIISWYWWR